jgi:hypothetical protein
MRAWYALTQGNYRGAIQAASAGQDAAPSHSVSVQLFAQGAKAWARIGDRRQVEVALDAGRRVLESLPFPENLDNHFVVDPAKFDFYAMDCYRIVGEDQLANLAAHEVIRRPRTSTGHCASRCASQRRRSRSVYSQPETVSQTRPSTTDAGHWPVSASRCLRC